jgi:DHA1 family purine base/nucleoside efflux pump-like MFS transporter
MSPRPKEEWRVLACLFSILFVGVADNQILSPLLPFIRAQFKASAPDMGLLFTGYSFCAGLAVLFWGPLSDAFGRKQGLCLGLMIFGAGSVLSSMSGDFAGLFTARIVTGMGASMLSLNTLSYAADFFPYQNRGWAMGCIFSSYFAALILGVPLGSWMGERLGWNIVFAAMAGLSLAALSAVFFLLPALSRKGGSSPAMPLAKCWKRYGGFLTEKTSFGALMSSLFASAGTMGFLAFLGVWLKDSFGISGSRVGFVFLVSGIAALLASPFAGFIADRIGKRFQFILSSLFLALFLFILPGMHWGWALFAVFGAISVSAAFRQGPMEAVLTEIAPSDLRGTFVALKNSFSQLGIGLAGLLSGILFEWRGYTAVCVLGAISNLLAVGSILLTLRDRKL